MQMELKKSYKELEEELYEIRLQLEEANDTIEAIRTGEVDALVVKGEAGHQLYTLKSADQTYRMFIEKMNEGAITINKQGLILYCNSRFASMVEMPLAKVIGLPILDLVPEAYRQTFTEAIDKAWHRESKGEISLLKNNGQPAPFLFSLGTLNLDGGTVLSIVVADLSLQKETEKQLKSKNEQLQRSNAHAENLNNDLEHKVKERTQELLVSREHFKFLADNIPVIAWTALPGGEINYFNKRWYEYSGFNEGSFVFDEWIEVVHPADRLKAIEAWKAAVDTGKPFKTEYRFRRAADDMYRWHYGHALPYKNEHNQIIAWFGICTDIDYQKKELEMKDEFISMVSHELKTPVTSIKGYTQLLMLMMQREDGRDSMNGYLSTMNNQINKLTRLITDLLDATKSHSGQLQFDEEAFDFNALAKEIVGEMQLTTNHHHIRVQLGPDITVTGDRNRIGQVITNLISNAIKYSPDSDDIIVTSKSHDGQLIFCVKDFGIGIPKAQQSKLYTRFFRVINNQNAAHTFPGMGLGLYISRNIIEKHKGNMWVESEHGTGAEFYFSLPL
jgi:two-component system, OmpR family, phosphate regulon sensor histidine kinase PhoR